jgi:hypothetical protein
MANMTDLERMIFPRSQRPRRLQNRYDKGNAGDEQHDNRRTASPQCFHLSRKAGLRARGIGSVAFPQAFHLQWHRDKPALTYRCGGSTGLGVHARRTCFPFHPPAGCAGGHLERVLRFYTVLQQYRNRIGRARAELAGENRSGAQLRLPPGRDLLAARQRFPGPESMHRVNEIAPLAHHGKNIDNCLLLLDLSRFLKL